MTKEDFISKAREDLRKRKILEAKKRDWEIRNFYRDQGFRIRAAMR